MNSKHITILHLDCQDVLKCIHVLMLRIFPYWFPFWFRYQWGCVLMQ